MRNRGFTLVELLIVIGLMGLLGGIAVGGYRAMVRGMEERGVMQNVNAFIRAAYQRAQVDRQPTIVYFWNETLRSKTADEFEIVVGKAVAVRRSGRITRVDGSVLVDEFADLDKTYMTTEEQQQSGLGGGSGDALIELYPLDDLTSSSAKCSLVEPGVAQKDEAVQFLGGLKSDSTENVGEIVGYGFTLRNANGVTWKQGMAYGFEFQRLELPPGYIFGSSHSPNVNTPITDVGRLVFNVGRNTNSGSNTGGIIGGSTVTVSALRQNGATLSPVKIDDSTSPEGASK